MRSLFLRIFLWFWLAMITVVALLVLSSPYWTRVRPAVAQWEQRGFARLVEEATAVVARIEREGIDDLPSGRRGRERLVVELVDGSGQALGGRPLPPFAVDVVGRARASGETELERAGPHFMLARPLTLDDGREVTLLVSQRGGRPGHGPPDLGPETGVLEAPLLIPRLLAAVLVVGVLCWWLSRHLTRPLRSLDEAVRALDGGDLEARAGAVVAARGDEIGALARDFNRMADRLVGALESQRRLLRDVSHELRSPLARLEVAIELVRRQGSVPESHLERIERESARMEELIARLLVLARLEQEAGDRPRDPVDLGELVGAVIEDAGFEEPARELELSASVDGPVITVGDVTLLRSALDNVVRNALRHGPEGSAVEVELGREGGCWLIRVRDHGPGVPEDQLGRIFDPFHRVGEDRDPCRGGVGLGLSIARRAVEWHGGTVVADNHPRGGLVVAVRLPVGSAPGAGGRSRQES